MDLKGEYNDSSSCRPPSGSTYLTIGQDLFAINEYVISMYNASLHSGSDAPLSSFIPAAFMFYTDIASLNGTSTPTDYGSGVEYSQGVFELFPNQSSGLQVGLWLFGANGCRKIVSGQMDEEIDHLVHFLETSPASKIFLRIGYEFDNPYFNYSSNPKAYVAAFQRIVTVCQEKLSHTALSKVKFVWHSWAASLLETEQLQEFYPGDLFVDW